MYEHHKQPLAKPSVFAKRLALNGIAGFVLLIFSLGIGMAGYHFLEGLTWIDSLSECIHDPGRDGSCCSLTNNRRKNIRIFLCVLFRGGFAGCRGYFGCAYFSSLHASFSSG